MYKVPHYIILCLHIYLKLTLHFTIDYFFLTFNYLSYCKYFRKVIIRIYVMLRELQFNKHKLIDIQKQKNIILPIKSIPENLYT